MAIKWRGGISNDNVLQSEDRWIHLGCLLCFSPGKRVDGRTIHQQNTEVGVGKGDEIMFVLSER